MPTVTLWLLIGIGANYRPHVVLERFATKAECERIAAALLGPENRPPLLCIQATVARP